MLTSFGEKDTQKNMGRRTGQGLTDGTMEMLNKYK